MKQLVTPRLILRTVQKSDFLKLKEFEERNKNHFAQWETVLTELSDNTYQQRLGLWEQEFDKGTAIRFFLFTKADSNENIIGMCNFTQIFRGPFQACYLGYKIDHEYEGKRLMSEALRTSITYVFDELNLHRIMANYIPSNMRSAQLLQRLGFTIEGKAKAYLLINGVWQDHILTALINENWRNEKKSL